jgi:hypothetical protein
MTNKTFFYVSSLMIIPAFFVLFLIARVLGRVYEIDQWVQKWDTLLMIASLHFLLRSRQVDRTLTGNGCSGIRRIRRVRGGFWNKLRYRNTI